MLTDAAAAGRTALGAAADVLRIGIGDAARARDASAAAGRVARVAPLARGMSIIPRTGGPWVPPMGGAKGGWSWEDSRRRHFGGHTCACSKFATFCRRCPILQIENIDMYLHICNFACSAMQSF